MITAVVTHWGSEHWPAQAEALAAMVKSGELGEVVVAEAESTGELRKLAIAKELADVVTWLEVPALVSVGALYNQSIAAARGEWVLQLNGDITPVPGSALIMQAWLAAHPEAGLIGGDFWFGEVGQLAQATPAVASIDSVLEAGIALGQYGLSRRSLWDTLKYDESGPFAEPGWGGDDNDLGCQIRALGLSLWMVQSVTTPTAHKGQFYYLHAGPHASVDKLIAKGIDTLSLRGSRNDYLEQKWAKGLPDGKPWYWERADAYRGDGRYSLRALDEMDPARLDQGVALKIDPAITGNYAPEPV